MTEPMADPGETPELGARFVEWVGAIARLVEEQDRLRQVNATLAAQVETMAQEVAELRAQLGQVPGALERAARAETKLAVDAKIKELETLWKKRKG
jgi:predicted RNase H-like nuclease (RuvC/YqgF family)